MKYCFYCQQELREEQYYCGNCGHWRGAEEDEPQAPSVSTSLDAVGVCPECLRDIAADEQTIRCKKCGAEYHVHCFDSITECVAPACIGEREATGGDREKADESDTTGSAVIDFVCKQVGSDAERQKNFFGARWLIYLIVAVIYLLVRYGL